MNKKLFTVLFIAVFLMASISFVSAADNIPVKVIWDDANQANERPDEITVNLLCDGKVVDTAKLNAFNSWKTTFKGLNDDGNYEVKVASKVSNYSTQVRGSAESGFVITGKIIAETLGSSAEDASLENIDETPVGDDTTTGQTDNNAAEPAENNATDKNATDKNATDGTATNETDTENNTTDDETTDGADVASNTPTVDKQSPTKDNNKNVKQVKKNDNKTVKPKHGPTTGIPIAGLVLVLFAVAFVPFSRKK
ncbi:Cna B-type domain-containing protein [Methanobrevibacter sp.]|uniref:Cna B-type domain-containing protein n=1 Tax=Methanobrevibacter sp. TaxID=66852 RepID=UPI003870A6EE